jgi:hypothetical protein
MDEANTADDITTNSAAKNQSFKTNTMMQLLNF